MPNEVTHVPKTPELDIPNPRPYVIGAMVATALAYTLISRLVKSQSNGAVWGTVSSVASGARAPREWTSAFSESDGFLAQLKNIAPTEVVKNS